MKCIELNNPKTYPVEFIKELEKNKETIKNEFLNYKAIKENTMYKDGFISINENKWDFDNYTSNNEQYQRFFSNVYILCYHYTRLMEDEIIDIKTNGFKTFACNKFKTKKIRCIGEKQSPNEGRDNDRNKNLVHFVFSKTKSKSKIRKWGLNSFVELWGGEYINQSLNAFSQNKVINKKLSMEGKPCIIKFTVKVLDLQDSGLFVAGSVITHMMFNYFQQQRVKVCVESHIDITKYKCIIKDVIML